MDLLALRSRQSNLKRRAQTAVMLVLAVVYFSYVFQMWQRSFLHSGIGDWGDPHFINFILEHWYYSLTTFGDPASPPMFFPARGTLGYSHGLVLYAPIYAIVRSVLDPLQSHSVTILLVLLIGSMALYAILREIIGVGFVEAALLTTFFATSRNVINPGTSIWSQTASVFLLPPILLITLLVARMPRTRFRTVTAAVGGLLATLLFTQEFYTAQYALFCVCVCAVALLARDQPSVTSQVENFWREERRVLVRIAAVVMVLAGAWALGLLMLGGGAIEVAGVRVASNDWRRPAALCLAAAVLLVYRRGRPPLRVDFRGSREWIPPFIIGAGVGGCVFLWIYLPAYLQNPGFSKDELMGMLTPYHSGRWYESFRPFWFAFGACVVACVPVGRSRIDAATRRYCAGFLLLSVIVLLAPVRFDTFSVWTTFIRPLPGFAAIRDPRRIIHVYELLLVLLTGVFLTRLSTKAPVRVLVSALLFLFIITDWNREVFVFSRKAGDFQRWVAAPVAVDPACRSFVIKPASETYSSRWDNKYVLYGMDASFVALNHSLPTLNGYSAWVPEGWHFTDPGAATYGDHVSAWIQRHRLAGVCEFDIETRKMRPYGLETR